MRRPFTMLTVVSACALLALAAVAALGASLMRSSAAATRTFPLTLSPAPDDLALAQVSFHPARRERLSPATLRVLVSGPFGEDYMAAAALRSSTSGVVRALVLLVNRPSSLLEPTAVRLKLMARRSLGAASIRTLENPLASGSTAAERARAAAKAALCDLPLHGAALTARELSALSSHGSPLAAFTAAEAVAQAYDLACGLPVAPGFEHDIAPAAPRGERPTGERPTSEQPTTTTTTTTTSPPPVGKLPGEGCTPAPGYACPG